ncbi:MAG: hypothetical protein ACREM3_29340 [Candidatus Rokuibacteriota bacterium]
MTDQPVLFIREVRIDARPRADRLSQVLLLILALALAWQVAQPHLTPTQAEAGRETVTVNVERIGGRHLLNGIISIKCGDVRP